MEIPALHDDRTVGTQKGKATGNGKTGESAGEGTQEKPCAGFKGVRRPNKSRREPAPYCQEKPLWFIMNPYRKPTQVDEERILRPTEEALLRNSAK